MSAGVQEIRAALAAGRGADPVRGLAGEEVWRRARERPASAAYRERILARAAGHARTPLAPVPFSLHRRFAEDGSRAAYDGVFAARRRRLTDLALAALLDPGADLAALEDTIWAVCDEYVWALPAHLDQLLSPAPSVPHAEQIDLVAAETAFTLAEIRRLLGARLAPLVAERVRREVERRVLGPFLARAHWWEKAETNWSAVCGAGVGMAALHLLGEAEESRLAEITARVLAAMDHYLAGFGADGACREGLDYWSYGFGHFALYAEALRRRTAGRIDLFADRTGKVTRIARFPWYAFLSGNAVAAFADTQPRGALQPGLLGLLGRRFPGLPAVPDAWLVEDVLDAPGRWGAAVRSLGWEPPADGGEPPGPGGYLADAQWMVHRVAGAGAWGFAAKGGHNAEPHNHNDLGSFVVAAHGEPLLADLGVGTYTREYFGPGRYEVLCNGSQGHSVPLVSGRRQHAGAGAAARVLEAEHTGMGCRFALDLTAAYDVAELTSLTREFTVTPDGLTLRDTYAGAAPLEVIERFVSYASVELPEPGRAVLRGARGALELVYDATRWRAEPGELRHGLRDGSTAPVRVLDLRATLARGACEVTVTPLR
ncbi:heparinase II/III family protein [Streptomyces sp. NPDC001255]|uniref:heparinase II/III domain-containing protein n=1 Tax=Streptomyces sp. NPDC001255 TaxID=3364550 RepID=UPI0036B14512